MSRAVFDRLLDGARAAHEGHAALSDFCAFPDDIRRQDVSPFHIPPSDLLQKETGLFTDCYNSLRDAFVEAAPHAHWRETYKGTDIGDDFMDRFGCYCLIGENGAFVSERMCAWVVYMPAHLHYPWHHHPGEESYLILAGEAEFRVPGQSPETLRAGDLSVHASNQPHATDTHDHPMMAYVIWRNGFETAPVLTPPDMT